MTVAELIAYLQQHPSEATVTACWDCIASWDVHRVIGAREDGRLCVVLDVGTGDGDLSYERLEDFDRQMVEVSCAPPREPVDE